ncbi:MAG: hypothetical protein OXU19_08860 [bacterium]|nr:hypothetical protein [bacterium]MDE0417348.1 hypothetical protein [bacterium]
MTQLLLTDADGSHQAICDLRRPRLRDLIERIPSSDRDRLAQAGQRVTLAWCRTQPAQTHPHAGGRLRPQGAPKLGRLVRSLDDETGKLRDGQPLAA